MPELPARRNTNRIPQHDYSKPGYYFITIIIHNRDEIFGIIENNQMVLNVSGDILKTCLCDIPAKYDNIELDSYTIMPNHVHCIINLSNIVGAVHEPPDNKPSINKITKNMKQIKHINNNKIMIDKRAIHELPLQYKRRDMLMSKMVGYIKMRSAKQINLLRDTSR